MSLFDYKKKQDEKERLILMKHEEDIILAEQIRNFFSTDIGKYLQEQMDNDQAAIKNRIIVANAYDNEEIQTLQNEYQVITKIKNYFGKALLNGNSAEKALNLRRNEEFN